MNQAGSMVPDNIRRITEQEWIQQMECNQSDIFAVVIYTPMCGTCKLAMQMISLTLQAGVKIPVYAANIYDIPHFVEMCQIESVPCFMIWQGKDLIRKEYAVHSVDQLYKWFKEVEI